MGREHQGRESSHCSLEVSRRWRYGLASVGCVAQCLVDWFAMIVIIHENVVRFDVYEYMC